MNAETSLAPRRQRPAPPTSQRSHKLDLACDILKLLRTQALDRVQIQRELRYSRGAIERYTKELQDNGLLHSWKPADAEGLKGRVPRVFAVRPIFGGTVQP